jgi:hypothetical protein
MGQWSMGQCKVNVSMGQCCQRVNYRKWVNHNEEEKALTQSVAKRTEYIGTPRVGQWVNYSGQWVNVSTREWIMDQPQ